ncbi:response regulator transcription factor [Thiovibrio sp. JS02]
MKKQILVVDDDALLVEMISYFLKMDGHLVTTARNGKEALSLLAAYTFDLVLCDIHMDGRDGFAILAASKALQPETKVILSSGDVVYETISMAFQCGADDFLAKPFLVSELQHQISLCLDRKRQKKMKIPASPASVAQAHCQANCRN